MINGSPVLKEGTLNALGVLCEEIVIKKSNLQVLIKIINIFFTFK